MNGELEFLDLLTIVSFVLQLQNQSKIFSLQDIQNEVNRAVTEIHKHLEIQDEKIDSVLTEIKHEGN